MKIKSKLINNYNGARATTKYESINYNHCCGFFAKTENTIAEK